MATLLEHVGNAKLYRLWETVPALGEDQKLELDPGLYHIGIFIRSSVTGTTTTIGTVLQYADAQLVQAVSTAYGIVEPNAGGFGAPTIALPAGAAGRFFYVIPAANSGAPGQPVPIAHGLRLSVVKGTAVTGERLEVDVLAVRVDGVIPPVVS